MKKDVSGKGAGDMFSLWQTPDWCTEGLLQHWPGLLAQGTILEPSAGEGAIVRVLLEHGAEVHAVEYIEARCNKLRRFSTPYGMATMAITCGNFLQGELLSGQRFGAIIQNPPYRPPWAAIRHVKRAFDVARPDAIIACLLPISFLSGGSGRRDFWRTAPPVSQVLFFSHRPKFAATGGMFETCWIVWDLGQPTLFRSPVMIERD